MLDKNGLNRDPKAEAFADLCYRIRCSILDCAKEQGLPFFDLLRGMNFVEAGELRDPDSDLTVSVLSDVAEALNATWEVRLVPKA